MAAPYAADVVGLLRDNTSYGVAGDHGGAQQPVQEIPIVFAGAGVGKHDSKAPMRSVDILPTILSGWDRRGTRTSTARRWSWTGASLGAMSDRALAERLVRAAGAVALELRGGAAESKGAPTDVVTEADRRAEAVHARAAARRAAGRRRARRGGRGRSAAASGAGCSTRSTGRSTTRAGCPPGARRRACSIGAGALACAVYDPVAGELFSAARGDGATLDGAALRVPPARPRSRRRRRHVRRRAPPRRGDRAPAPSGCCAASARCGRRLRHARARLDRRRPARRLGPGGRRAVGLAPGRAARRRGRRRGAGGRPLARRRGAAASSCARCLAWYRLAFPRVTQARDPAADLGIRRAALALRRDRRPARRRRVRAAGGCVRRSPTRSPARTRSAALIAALALGVDLRRRADRARADGPLRAERARRARALGLRRLEDRPRGGLLPPRACSRTPPTRSPTLSRSSSAGRCSA